MAAHALRVTDKKFEFVGTNARSRTGCLTCKRKKKKCDEVRPICGLCSVRNTTCVWVGPRKNRRRSDVVAINMTQALDVVPVKVDEDHTCAVESTKNSDTATSPTTNGTHTPRRLTYNDHVIEFESDRERIYFDKFFQVAQTMSIVGGSQNLYYTIYIPIASRNAAVLQALIAWGGFAMGGTNETISRQIHYKRALELLDSQTRTSLDRKELRTCLAGYMILLDAELTTGDIKNWPKLYRNAVATTEAMGLYTDLSDPIKIPFIDPGELWMVKNLAYHNLVSSTANIEGTFLLPAIVEQLKGMDCVYGCLGPIFGLLSETINLSIEAKQKYKLLEDPGKINNFNTTAQMNDLHERALLLEARMVQSKPIPQVLSTIPQEELELHLSLYELFQFTSQMYLRLVVRRYPPCVPEVQVLLYKVLNLLILLNPMKIKSLMKFPVMIAGVSCIYECDKAKLMNLMSAHEDEFEFSKISRIRSVVEEVWQLNPQGNLCLDWFEIVCGFGWTMCLT